MLKRVWAGGALLTTAFGLTGSAWAVDCGAFCDTSGRAGSVWENSTSTVVYGGGSAAQVRIWTPLIIDAGKMLLDPAVVQIVDGRILGATTTFAQFPGTGELTFVASFGTADSFNDNGGYTSNDIMVAETLDTASNNLGEMLADGTTVFRAAFNSSVPQNNLEWVQAIPNHETDFPIPSSGTKIFASGSPGIDGTPGGSVFLSTPAALDNGSGGFYVGNANFNGGTTAVPNAVNIWDYNGVPLSPATPTFSYTQTDGFTFANTHCGGCIDAVGDVRQTAPVLATVGSNHYVAFGINDTNAGGSARPAVLVIDTFAPGAFNGYTGAVAITPPSGFLFVDHQATGGGSGPFESNHFSMNSSGQIAALIESTASVPSYAVAVYDPVLTAGVITGYTGPTIIADAGPIDNIADDLAGPIPVFDPNGAIVEYINSISGVGINDLGNVSFSATYDTGIVDPNDPNFTIWDTAAYVYQDSSATLHQLLVENQSLVDGPSNLDIGLLAQEGSDSFYGRSLTPDANVMAFQFRSSSSIDGGSRGVAVVAFGHSGDINFDCAVDLADLSELLVAFGTTFGSPGYDPQADLNLDGTIDLTDLSELLVRFGGSGC